MRFSTVFIEAVVCSRVPMTAGQNQNRTEDRLDSVSTVLLVVIAGVPLAIGPHVFMGYVATPKLALAWLASVALLLSARHWLSGFDALKSTRYGRVYFGLLFAQTVSLGMSTLFSNDWQLSFFGTTARRLGACNQADLIFLTAVAASYLVLKPSLTGQVFVTIEITGAVAAIYGISQYFGLDPLLPAELYTNQFTVDVARVPATFGHAMIFANFLLPVILIASSSLLVDQRRNWRRLHWTVLLISAGALILSGTRSALLGLVVGSFVLAYFYRQKFKTRRIVFSAFWTVLVIAVAMTVFALSPTGRSFRVRVLQWKQDSMGGPRLLVWRDSLVLVRQHWLVGIGPEEFAGEFRKIQSLQLARAYPDHYHEAVHNLFLEVGISQGIVGEFILLSLLGLTAVCGFRKARQSDVHARVLLACLAGLIVSLQFPPLAFTNFLYLYLIMGMLIGLPDPDRTTGKQPVEFSPWTNLFFGVGAVAGGAIFFAYVGQDYCFAATVRALTQGNLEEARRSYSTARRFPLPGPELWCSRQWAVLARSLHGRERAFALEDAKRASADAERNHEERFDAYYQSAVLALITGNVGQAESKLRESIAAAPVWYRPRVMLAEVLSLTGQNREANQQESVALQCAGVHESEVKLALDRARERRYEKLELK